MFFEIDKTLGKQPTSTQVDEARKLFYTPPVVEDDEESDEPIQPSHQQEQTRLPSDRPFSLHRATQPSRQQEQKRLPSNRETNKTPVSPLSTATETLEEEQQVQKKHNMSALSKATQQKRQKTIAEQEDEEEQEQDDTMEQDKQSSDETSSDESDSDTAESSSYTDEETVENNNGCYQQGDYRVKTKSGWKTKRMSAEQENCFSLKLDDQNKIVVMYNFEPQLVSLKKEVEKAPWRQNFSKKTHWGVRFDIF